MATSTPVILTGMLNSWPCLEKWNCEFLGKTNGDLVVSVDVTPAGHGDCVIDDKTFVQPEQRQMRLGSKVLGA